VRVIERDVATGQESDVFTTTALPPIQRLALSPSGDRIAFVTRDLNAHTTSLNVVSVPGGQVRTLATATFPATIIYGYDLLEWSRDGRFIYFVKKGEVTGQQVWRVVVESGELAPIGVTITPFAQGIAVDPDGSRLAFAAGEIKAEVWVMENFLPVAQNRKASVAKR
jgi:Tol biopolymer transport system component